MKMKNKLIFSLLASYVVLILSFLMPLIPCKISPLVPNAKSTWLLCSLNPDTALIENSLRVYFGQTKSLLEAYFLVIFLSFLISFIAFHYLTKRSDK